MAWDITAITAENLIAISWRDGKIHVEGNSDLSKRIRKFLSGDHTFFVTEQESEDTTAWFGDKKRPIANEFELATVSLKIPNSISEVSEVMALDLEE